MKNKASKGTKTKPARKPSRRTCIGAPPAPRNPESPQPALSGVTAPAGIPAPVGSVISENQGRISVHMDEAGNVVIAECGNPAVVYLSFSDLRDVVACLDRLIGRDISRVEDLP